MVGRRRSLLAAHQVVEGGVAHHPLHEVAVGVSPAAQEVVHLPAPPLPEFGIEASSEISSNGCLVLGLQYEWLKRVESI